MGDGKKKELAFVDGKPVIVRAVLPFIELEEIESVVITTRSEDIASYEKTVSSFAGEIPIAFIAGGETRQDSVRIGLESLATEHPEYVLIHDGARPWISRRLIRTVMDVVEKNDACIPVVHSTDALKRIRENRCMEHIARDDVYHAQTPQGFRFETILAAHRVAVEGDRRYVDDAEVYAAFGGTVFTIDGDPRNRKITHPHDLEAV